MWQRQIPSSGWWNKRFKHSIGQSGFNSGQACLKYYFGPGSISGIGQGFRWDIELGLGSNMEPLYMQLVLEGK